MPDPGKAKAYFENKLSFTLGPVELDHKIKDHENVSIIDVREEEDYQKGHVPGAINLPRERWDSMEGLSKDRTNILYCYAQTCHLAATAAVKFADKGYSVMELEGGWEEWKGHDLEVETQGHRAVSVSA